VIGVVVLRILLTVFRRHAAHAAVPAARRRSAAGLDRIGLVVDEDRGERDRSVHASERLVAAVRTVVVADLVMSSTT